MDRLWLQGRLRSIHSLLSQRQDQGAENKPMATEESVSMGPFGTDVMQIASELWQEESHCHCLCFQGMVTQAGPGPAVRLIQTVSLGVQKLGSKPRSREWNGASGVPSQSVARRAVC